MKKIILFIAGLCVIYTLNSQTVTYPASTILADSILENVHTKLTANSNLSVTGDGENITVTGSSMRLTYDDLALIVTNGGSVNGYQLVIKAPIAFASQNVNVNCPDRENAFGNVLIYENYFVNGNVKVSGGYMYAITVNYKSTILSGTQVSSIASQARLLYGGSNSDYIMLTTDPEFVNL